MNYDNISLLIPTPSNILKIEQIRYNAYSKKVAYEELKNTYYAQKLLSQEIICFIYTYHDEVVAGCYVSSDFNSLYVEQLFVLKKYQEVGLHLGQKLLSSIIENKNFIEHYFNKEFTYTKISPCDPKSNNIYKKMGYRLIHKSLNIFGKKI